MHICYIATNSWWGKEIYKLYNKENMQTHLSCVIYLVKEKTKQNRTPKQNKTKTPVLYI